MQFGLSVETSVGMAAGKTNVVYSLLEDIKSFLGNREYGADLQRIGILVICVAPEFDFFSKVRKPKYTTYRKYVREGIEFVEDRIFAYDIKLDFESFRNQSDYENKKMLASEILSSLTNLDALPKKVKDFDKERFKEDMRMFFREKKLA